MTAGRKVALSVFFILLLAYAVPVARQIVTDPEALSRFVSLISSLPACSLPDVPLEGGCMQEYLLLKDRVARMNSIAGELSGISADLSPRSGLIDRLLNFFGIYRDEKKVNHAISLYNEWMELYGSIDSSIFDTCSSQYNLSLLRGVFSLKDGTTFTDIESAFSGMEPGRVVKIPTDIPAGKERACIILHGNSSGPDVPCYVVEPLRETIRFTPGEPEFLSRQELLLLLEYPDLNLPEYCEYVSKLVQFTKSAVDFEKKERADVLRLLEEVNRQEFQLEQRKQAMNDSLVQSALSILGGAYGIRSVREFSPEESLNRAAALVNRSGGLGERILRLLEARRVLSEAERVIQFETSGISSSIEVIREGCEHYREKSGAFVYCGYDDPRLLARSFFSAYEKYLEMEGESSTDALKETVRARIDDLAGTLSRMSPFLPVKSVLSFRKKLDGLRAGLVLADTREDIEKIERELGDLEDDLCYEFLADNYDEITGIHDRFLGLYRIALELGVNVSAPSVFFSDPLQCESALSILENREFVNSLASRLSEYRDGLASSLPSTLSCSTPVLGVEFDEVCVVNVTNPWPDTLKEAFAYVELPYPASRIDGRNFYRGDLSHLSSASGSGRDLKLSLRDVPASVILLFRYRTEAPPARVFVVNETSQVNLYSVTYGIESSCSGSAYALLPHPFHGYVMNSTHPYWFYNESWIAVNVSCGYDSVTFSGIPYTVKDGKVVKIVNTSLPLFISVDNAKAFTLVGGEKVALVEDAISASGGAERDNRTALEQNVTLPDSLRARAAEVLGVIEGDECVPENIVKEVRERFYVPKPRCFFTEGDRETARRLFDGGNYSALLGFPHLNEARVYLSTCEKYRKDAEISIGELRSLLTNPVSKRIAGKYLVLADRSYRKGNYIAAIYYARFGILKAPLNLETPARILIAVLVVAAGLLTGRKNDEEELI